MIHEKFVHVFSPPLFVAILKNVPLTKKKSSVYSSLKQLRISFHTPTGTTVMVLTVPYHSYFQIRVTKGLSFGAGPAYLV